MGLFKQPAKRHLVDDFLPFLRRLRAVNLQRDQYILLAQRLPRFNQFRDSAAYHRVDSF